MAITDVKDRNGKSYTPNQCWIELSDAIENAQKLIYICGWSVKHDITLLRTGKDDEQFGTLLKRKADAGVVVLILLWDEALSNDLLPGLMGTHDERTYEYFKGTNVQCLRSSRAKDESNAFEKQV